jgi:hypothetical protein
MGLTPTLPFGWSIPQQGTRMMKYFLIMALVATFSLLAADALKDDASPLYEMRVYYAHDGKLDDLNARFRNHTVKLFEKHGMTNIGYWVPVDNKENKLVYVLSYPNREAREKAWKEFSADPEWDKARKESEKNGPLVKKADVTFMKLTDYSPKPKVQQKGDRVFELRTYSTHPGKLENLNARFGNHTLKLFEKHGMENLWYWVKTSEQKEANTTLIYLLAHKSADAGKASFDAFRKDPDWIAAKTKSEEAGPITIEGGVKSEILKATDYSPTK